MSGRRDTPAATAVPRIPDTVEELLTPAWVTSALAGRFPGVRVTSVTPGPVVSRVSTNVRFHIEGELPDGLCPDLCVKGYFSELGASYRHVGEPEAYFYRDIAGSTGMRTLRSVYADVDPATRHGVVITEDIVAQGGKFLDARSDYTPDQTAESLGELAKLHAATWSQSHYADAPLLASRLESYFAVRGVADIRGNFEGPIGARVPDAVRDAERLADVFARLAVSTPSVRPWAVIHGDAHVGNVYLDGGGRPAFLDWQLVQRGPWYLDVGYHLVSALTIEDRRRTERDLVQHYLDRLRAGGVDAPTSDDAWSGIRRGIVYGFFLWGITLKVDPAVTSTLLERLGTATADHDAFAAVA